MTRLLALAVVVSTPALAQPVKNRISVLIDSSGSMLLTPEIITYTETCTPSGWNPCTFNGNPTLAQETCNTCVIDTIAFDSTCASTWDASCRADYTMCVQALTGQACSATLTVSEGIATRGDGSNDLPGCDLNGDGLANDSRMFKAKQAFSSIVSSFGELEFSLWRYTQVTGGQTCPTTCPSPLLCEDHDNNAGTAEVCALDADRLDNVTTAGFEGQCNLFTWTGAPAAFTCNHCNFTSSYDQATCRMFDLDRVRTNAVSPLNGTSNVTCYPPADPTHRYIRYAGTCTGGEQLVSFPATGFNDNYLQLLEWVDHNQSPFASTNELRAHGGTPIAASLRNMRASVLANATADTRTPCRKHSVIFITDGAESCETVADAVTAAGAFQNMSFTNAAGVFVPDYDVPVYVLGFAICPPGNPNCQTRQDLNAIAAAGGTGQAIPVNDELELFFAMSQIAAGGIVNERCNDADDDCDGLTDETFPGKGSPCSAGAGLCFRSGTVVCSTDQLSLTCSAAPGAPTPEICNGLDDDCDGLVDDGISCQGCVPVCSPAANCDVCNGVDEDCDTQLDEDAVAGPCGVDTGQCQSGTTACVAGQTVCNGSIPAVPEVCNGADDDCDGVDDGFTEPCYPADAGCDLSTGACTGQCRIGVHTCSMGSFDACAGARVPSPEIGCNLVDEDCDGFALPTGGSPEQCNGLDDDCDGVADDGVASTDPDLGLPCGPPVDAGCGLQGTVRCVGGAEVCGGATGPPLEICNGLDDDCDGVADDSVTCGGNAECVRGACLVPCGPQPFPCGGNEACLIPDGGGPLQRYCLPDPCVGVTCPVTHACDSNKGSCVDLCNGVMCRMGETCRAGFCLDCLDQPATCVAPLRCRADSMGVGQCVADPCAPNPCPMGQRCTEQMDGTALCSTGAAGGSAGGGSAGGATAGAGGASAGSGGGAMEPGRCGCDASGSLLGLAGLLLFRRRRLARLLRLALFIAACSGPPAPPDAGSAGGATAGGATAGGATAGGGTGGGGTADGGLPCLPDPERCNGRDDDCDGMVDEGFNLSSDPNHCGGCGNVCTYLNATGLCDAGTCVQGSCAPGFLDLDASVPGCESACLPTNGAVERCDGVDNDCDGVIDDGDPGGGAACGVDAGICTAGTLHCVAGALTCDGIGPAAESCNDADDDCDGVVDDGFDKLNDPTICGDCTPCNVAHAVAGCDGGACSVALCLQGWVDLDGLPGNGCEYPCTPSGPEVCNGRDDDCDGLTDVADPSLLVPMNFCRQLGECAGTQPSCAADAGWDCVYLDPDVEKQPNGDPVFEETRCDGRDNDCDGAPDEVFPLKNTPCGEDGTFGTTRRLGACRGTGQLVCNAAGTGLRCNVTVAGAAAASETCNDRDDDCDGHVDEGYDFGGFNGVRDAVSAPLTIGGASVVAYLYEASRPDSTPASPGFATTRACSVQNRMPWAQVSFTQARTACLAAGMRLCRVVRNAGGQAVTDEWGRYCEGSANRVYPYGNVYSGSACNGSDFDPVPGGVNEDQAIATGSLATCTSLDSTRDQSGNLHEWVDDPRVVGGQAVHTLRGGAFDGAPGGLTCDIDLRVVPPTYSADNVGFRCCGLACAAGQAECSGTCVDLASSNSHCGACGATCAGGQTCSNGYCCPTGTRACGDVCVAVALPCP